MIKDIVLPLSIRVTGKVISYLIFLYISSTYGSELLGAYGVVLNTMQLVSSLACIWLLLSMNSFLYENKNIFYKNDVITERARQFFYDYWLTNVKIGLIISLIYFSGVLIFSGHERGRISEIIIMSFLILTNTIYLYNQNSIKMSRKPTLSALSSDFSWSIIFSAIVLFDIKFGIISNNSINLIVLIISVMVLLVNQIACRDIAKNINTERNKNINKLLGFKKVIYTLGASSSDIIASKMPIVFGGMININPKYLGIFMLSSIPLAIYQMIDAVIVSKFGANVHELSSKNEKYKQIKTLILSINTILIILIVLIINLNLVNDNKYKDIFPHLLLFLLVGYIKYGYGLVSIKLLTMSMYKIYIINQMISILFCLSTLYVLKYFDCEYVYTVAIVICELSFHMIGKKYVVENK